MKEYIFFEARHTVRGFHIVFQIYSTSYLEFYHNSSENIILVTKFHIQLKSFLNENVSVTYSFMVVIKFEITSFVILYIVHGLFVVSFIRWLLCLIVPFAACINTYKQFVKMDWSYAAQLRFNCSNRVKAKVAKLCNI